MSLQSLGTSLPSTSIIMARVTTFTQPQQPVRALTLVVRKLAVTGKSCALCGSPDIRPSNLRNATDIFMACLFLAPFRCRLCRGRFYRLWRPSLRQSTDSSGAPLQVIRGRRKRSEAEVVEPRHIQAQPVRPPRIQPQLISSVMKAEVIAPGPVETPAAIPRRTGPGAVLILQNDLSIRKLLRRLLERRGYFTVEIAQLEDLANELRDRHADLLIMDVAAGGPSGVQAAMELAAAHPHLKILALAEQALPDNEIPGRLQVLLKPFPLDSFVDRVDGLLQRSSPLDTVQ
jgi:CheY-like chemotaxis protein